MQKKFFHVYGGNILDKYTVKLYARAYQDLEEIYSYFPERGAIRRVGAYSNKDYRQLFLKNYTIVYRIVKPKKEVHVITIRYTPRFL